MTEIRIRRVGSLTAGISLVGFGVLFILQWFIPALTYGLILRLWPLMLIGLGIELLLSNLPNIKYVYDKGAIALMVIMALLSACMAGADILYRMGEIRF